MFAALNRGVQFYHCLLLWFGLALLGEFGGAARVGYPSCRYMSLRSEERGVVSIQDVQRACPDFVILTWTCGGVEQS